MWFLSEPFDSQVIAARLKLVSVLAVFQASMSSKRVMVGMGGLERVNVETWARWDDGAAQRFACSFHFDQIDWAVADHIFDCSPRPPVTFGGKPFHCKINV